jgi:hypothetical protein
MTVNVNRDTTQVSGYTGTYSLPSPITATSTTLTATFYASADEAGSVCATATGTVTVTPGTSLSLASIALTSNVAKVTVTPATLTVGTAATQLIFSAYDPSNNLLALSAGSAKWAVSTGSADLTLTADGIATPVEAGSPTVTAEVDSVTSAAAAITVDPKSSSTITFEDLLPSGDDSGYISCMNSGLQFAGWVVHTVGAQDAKRACIWSSQTASVTELDTFNSAVTGISGSLECGFDPSDDAVTWNGSQSSVAILNSGGVANGVSGSTVVGSVYVAGNHSDAAIWPSGTMASFLDLNPPGAYASELLGTSNGVSAGDFQPQSGGVHAAYWNGTSSSAVDLAPSGVYNSYATAVDGGVQVGGTGLNNGISQAAMWNGSSATYVSLNPPGSGGSSATGVSGGYVVGLFLDAASVANAILWNATTQKYINLETPVSSTFAQSGATCIVVTSSGATVGGWASVAAGGNLHPVVWQVPTSALP